MQKWLWVAAGLLMNSPLLAQEQRNKAAITTLHDEYDSAAKRYVGVLTAEVFNLPSNAAYQRQMQALTKRVQNEGMTEEVLAALMHMNNHALADTASEIGIRVTRMDEFLSYFFDNKAKYIKPDSPLYERLVAADNTENPDH